MKSLLRFLVVLSAGVSLLAANAIPVYVFTRTDPGGIVDDDQRGRESSVKDLQKALADRKFQIVERAEDAAFTLEVIARGEQETGEAVTTTTRRPYIGGVESRTEARKTIMLVTKLTAGTYEKDIRSSEGIGFRQMAGGVAKQVERWAKQNAALLTPK